MHVFNSKPVRSIGLCQPFSVKVIHHFPEVGNGEGSVRLAFIININVTVFGLLLTSFPLSFVSLLPFYQKEIACELRFRFFVSWK